MLSFLTKDAKGKVNSHLVEPVGKNMTSTQLRCNLQCYAVIVQLPHGGNVLPEDLKIFKSSMKSIALSTKKRSCKEVQVNNKART